MRVLSTAPWAPCTSRALQAPRPVITLPSPRRTLVPWRPTLRAVTAQQEDAPQPATEPAAQAPLEPATQDTLQTPENAQGEPEVALVTLEVDNKESELLWRAPRKPLLKLGKSHVLPKHANSLKELVHHHHVVKVQLNGKRVNMDKCASDLATQAQVALVGIKGSVMLFVSSELSRDDLFAHAKVMVDKNDAYNQKRKELSERSEQARAALKGAQDGDEDDYRPRTAPRNIPRFTSDTSSGRERRQPGVPGGRKPTDKQSPVAARLNKGSERAQKNLDQVIARSLVPGPMTKETLKQEWVKLNEELEYEERVSAAEQEMKAQRTGRRTLFGRPAGNSWEGRGRGSGAPGGRGGRGGRGGGGRGSRGAGREGGGREGGGREGGGREMR